MHASSIVNYHHNSNHHHHNHHHHHHHNHHQRYYAHQVATEESSDASGLSFGQARSLVTPNQAIESDDNGEESGPEAGGHLGPAASAAPTAAGQDSLSSAPALTHLAGSESHKVHFVATYESHENSLEHYRYNNNNNNNNIISNDNAAPYQLASEAHYYEQQQQQQLISSTNCHQAVDLSAEQQQHGQFEAPAAIYYDLSAVEHISAASNLASLDYQQQDQQHSQHDHHHHQQNSQGHHHHHHHPNHHHHHLHQQLDISLQQRQEHSTDQQVERGSFAAYGHYEPANELQYSGEIVSVLAEQNRAAARPPEWQEGQPVVVADQATSSDGCHQLQRYSYEFSPILRPPEVVHQLDRDNSNVAYSSTFGLAPAGGSAYVQQIDTVASAAENGGNFHPANNENYHQPHIGQNPNDCPLFHNKQHPRQAAHTQYSPQQLIYETQLLDSNLAGHHNNNNHISNNQLQVSGESQRDAAPSRALSSVSDSLSMTTNSDMESIDSALTRDEKKAREANIPLSYHEIVNLSIDQFNEQLSRFPYSETQLTLMKDIRRRGKNKVAAQTCRKRKMEQITELQQEVAELANKRILLALERSRLVQEHAKLSEEYESWRTC